MPGLSREFALAAFGSSRSHTRLNDRALTESSQRDQNAADAHHGRTCGDGHRGYRAPRSLPNVPERASDRSRTLCASSSTSCTRMRSCSKRRSTTFGSTTDTHTGRRLKTPPEQLNHWLRAEGWDQRDAPALSSASARPKGVHAISVVLCGRFAEVA